MEVNQNLEEVKMIDLTIRAKEKNERKQEKAITYYNLKYKRASTGTIYNEDLNREKILPIINKSKSKDEINFNINNFKNFFDFKEEEFCIKSVYGKIKNLFTGNIKEIPKKYYDLKNINTDSFTMAENFKSKISLLEK